MSITVPKSEQHRFRSSFLNPSSTHLSCRTSHAQARPKCKLGYYRVFNLILRILYTGMQWKCLPVPTDAQGNPAIHYTTVYKVFAKWADDGSLWQAFVASVRHLVAEKHLDTSVLHGDGTNTVAKKGGMASGTRDTNIRRGRKSSPSSTIMATSSACPRGSRE